MTARHLDRRRDSAQMDCLLTDLTDLVASHRMGATGARSQPERENPIRQNQDILGQGHGCDPKGRTSPSLSRFVTVLRQPELECHEALQVL